MDNLTPEPFRLMRLLKVGYIITAKHWRRPCIDDVNRAETPICVEAN